LQQQIELVDPYVIALAGSTAVEAILGIKGGITRLRGQWQHWQGRLLMPLLHPAYLLRNPSPVDGAPIALTRGDLMSIRHRLSNVD
jgi:DNA polymerase